MKCKKCNDTGRVKIDCGCIDKGVNYYANGYCDCIVGENLLKEEMCLECGELKDQCVCDSMESIKRGLEDVKNGKVKKLNLDDL